MKEPEIGADAGIVVDLSDPDGGRVLKSAWIQAKRTHSLPGDIEALPRLAEQRRAMAARTTDGYAAIYTPAGIFLFPPGENRRGISPDVLLEHLVTCVRGDRRPEVIADTLDARHVLAVTVGPRRRGR